MSRTVHQQVGGIEAATNGNTAGNAEYHDTLARLSALVPSLADDIDLETDSIKGGTEALRQHANAYADDVKAQARQEYLNGIYEQYNDVLVESAANEAKLAAAQAKVEKPMPTWTQPTASCFPRSA